LNKTIAFDISLFEFKEFIDDQTALMLIKVCSSGDNLHGYPFTKETLKEAAERSLKGKPIVGKFSIWRDDFEGHSPLEVPVGYFIEHQNFQYIDNPDGSCSLFAYAVLWKNYASKEYDIFLRQKEKGDSPTKGVSMEINVGKWSEGWNGDMSKKEIKKFTFKGVTILGDRYTPASPGAQAEMVSFSKEKKKEVEKYFTENSDKINNAQDSQSLLGKYYKEFGLSTENFAEKEGEVMPEPEDGKNVEELEDKKFEEKVSEEPATEVGMEEEPKAPEAPETEEEKEEPEDFKAKYEELMQKYANLETCNATYMAENESLKAYKFQREDNDKIMQIEETIVKYSDVLPKDIIEGYRNRIEGVKLEDVTSFCNEIKASVVDFVGIKQDKNINLMDIPSLHQEPKKEKYWKPKTI